MSGRKLLLDSNIIIYLAKKELNPTDFLSAEDMLFISDISVMETLGYAFADPIEKQNVQDLISILIRLPIDDAVVQKAIAIRQSTRIKLPDAIIAATAMQNACILVTRDISDYASIADLLLLNPWQENLAPNS